MPGNRGEPEGPAQGADMCPQLPGLLAQGFPAADTDFVIMPT